MALFSKQNKEVLGAPLSLDNPVLVQVLGICSALAVTSQLKPAVVMGLAVTVITAFANVIISLIRKTIPMRIRIIVQLVVVAALVTIVSQVLKAFAYDVSVAPVTMSTCVAGSSIFLTAANAMSVLLPSLKSFLPWNCCCHFRLSLISAPRPAVSPS